MNVRVRASKTFFQAVLGYICTLGITDLDLGNKTAVYGVIIAALSAGLSALMNYNWGADENIDDTKEVANEDN